MFDFIQSSLYTVYFNYTIFFLILIAVFQCFTIGVFQRDIALLDSIWGVVFTILLILYMGLRPVSGVFGDTVNYASGFYQIKDSPIPFIFSWGEGEWVFRNLMGFFAKYSNINIFFLTCSFVYIGSLWLAMYRIFKKYYYLPLLIVFSMFTFWSYGVNGIRNGMGASLFILSLTYVNKVPLMILLAFIAGGIHKSVYLMMGAATIAWFLKSSWWYISCWIFSVVLSLIMGSTIQTYLSGLSSFTGDDRFSGYLTGSNMVGEVVQMSMTFRWDFLLYSSLGVIVGCYFIFVRRFKDEYYSWIYNIFIITNAFWILIIRAAYSNRFAQISWFMMPLVLIYPFIKDREFRNNEKIIGIFLLVFYAFTFYFNILNG